MTKIITTTPKRTEGFNISYNSEQESGKRLLKVLPKGWKVKFDWCQILSLMSNMILMKKKK